MASSSTANDDQTCERPPRSQETAPAHDRPQLKRRRLSEEQDGGGGGGGGDGDGRTSASRPQAFGHSTVSDNARAHFGHQYFHGDVVQHFHDVGPSQAKDNDLDQKKEAARRTDILNSLSFEHMQSRHLTIGRAQAKTCQWLLSRKEYKIWRNVDKLPEHHGFLWLKGKPAAGKSTAMKFLYDDALKEAAGVLVISFFFNARGDSLEMSVEGMYRSLIYQLLEKVPQLQSVLEQSWHGDRRQAWTIDLLQDIFFHAVLSLGTMPLVCYIDALDEGTEDDIRDMIHFLQRLAEAALTKGQHFFVCFSSRHYPHITIRKGQHVILESQEEHENDIAEYIRANLHVDETDIAEEIQSRASGVFLWVVLVVKILNKLYDRGRVDLLHARLREIPGGLNKLFEDILTRGPLDHDELVITIQWILFAQKPLRCSELYHAVLDTSTTPRPLSKVCRSSDMARFILDLSKGLAEITTGQKPVVQFIHESVRDYLIHGGGLAMLEPALVENIPGYCHDHLKSCCMRYVLATEDDVSQCLSGDNLAFERVQKRRKRLLKQRPFLQYALRGVIYHSDSALGHGVAQEAFLHHFPLGILVKAWNAMQRYPVRHHSGSVDLAYVLADKNATHLLQQELRQKETPLADSERYGTALGAAVMACNMHDVSLLLQHIPSPVSNDFNDLDNSLFLAMTQSSEAFRLILEHRPQATLGELGNRLLVRAITTSPKLARILLGRGARLLPDMNLHLPDLVRYTENELVELLDVQRRTELLDVLIDACDYSESQLLHEAVRFGNKPLVDRMLLRGVNVNADHGSSGGVLQVAIANYRHDIARQLLSAGVDVNVAGGKFSYALGAAIAVDNIQLFKELLDSGAHVDLPERYQGCETALHRAVSKGYDAIVRMLLERGAHVNMPSDCQWDDVPVKSALQRALSTGKEKIVEMLLHRGAFGTYWVAAADTRANPSGMAAEAQNEKLIAFSLEQIAQADFQNSGALDSTLLAAALAEAAARGNETLVKMLLDKGARDRDGMALHYATHFDHKNVQDMLLNLGEIYEAGFRKLPETLLTLASRRNDFTILKKLHSHSFETSHLSSALVAACESCSCSLESIDTLLAYGADINFNEDTVSRTPLEVACLEGRADLVEFLLVRHARSRPYKRYGGALTSEAISGHAKAIHLLLEARTHVDVENGPFFDCNRGWDIKSIEGKLREYIMEEI